MEKLTPAQQAPYIQRYLTDHGVTAGMGVEQIYAAVFGGNASRAGSTLYAQGSAGYAQNTGLDTNKDGKITSAEAAQEAVRAFGASGITLTQNITVMGNADPAAVAAIGLAGQNGLLLGQSNLNTEAGGGAKR